jgi:hypothetical protein
MMHCTVVNEINPYSSKESEREEYAGGYDDDYEEGSSEGGQRYEPDEDAQLQAVYESTPLIRQQMLSIRQQKLSLEVGEDLFHCICCMYD